MKYCQTTTILTKPASVHNLINCSSSRRFCTLSLWLNFRSIRSCSSVGSALSIFNKSVGAIIDSDRSITALVFSEPSVFDQILHTNLRNSAKIVSMVASSAQKWMDNVPPPLLFNWPRSNALVARNMGWALSLRFIMSSATLSHWPPSARMSVAIHFVAEPGPRNDEWPSRIFSHNNPQLMHFPNIHVHYSDFSIRYVGVHRHENNSLLELFWFTTKVLHQILDFLENLQRSVSWTILYSNSTGSPSVHPILCIGVYLWTTTNFSLIQCCTCQGFCEHVGNFCIQCRLSEVDENWKPWHQLIQTCLYAFDNIRDSVTDPQKDICAVHGDI